MAEMMCNIIMVFADTERTMIRSCFQKGIGATSADGKRVGRSPFGCTVEYFRVQTPIHEIRKGHEKHATAAFFEIPDSAI